MPCTHLHVQIESFLLQAFSEGNVVEGLLAVFETFVRFHRQYEMNTILRTYEFQYHVIDKKTKNKRVIN